MESERPRLLAISMRSTSEASYREDRDAIARDWWPFLKVALPGTLPLLLPNDPAFASALCATREVVGLLLTGGNDVGTCLERDRSETMAYRTVRDRGLPVLGVCRGLQFLVQLHGGTLSEGNPEVHRATRHRIEFLHPWHASAREVNSFHMIEARLPPGGDLLPTAIAPDDGLEAFQHRKEPVVGIHWHPEREPHPDPADCHIFRSLIHQGISP